MKTIKEVISKFGLGFRGTVALLVIVVLLIIIKIMPEYFATVGEWIGSLLIFIITSYPANRSEPKLDYSYNINIIKMNLSNINLKQPTETLLVNGFLSNTGTVEFIVTKLQYSLAACVGPVAPIISPVTAKIDFQFPLKLSPGQRMKVNFNVPLYKGDYYGLMIIAKLNTGEELRYMYQLSSEEIKTISTLV